MMFVTAISSFCLPGLGQVLQRRLIDGSLFFIAALWLHTCLLGMAYQLSGQVEWGAGLFGSLGFPHGGASPTAVVTSLLCLAIHCLAALHVLRR